MTYLLAVLLSAFYCAALVLFFDTVACRRVGKTSILGEIFFRVFATLADLKAWATKARRAKFYDHSGRRWADKVSGNGARK